ncbi:MAG TPA: serine hydrolase, partial [Cytophagales bacterium]|nr:serine hydrolase [Cytophagales bacterium]
MRYLPLLLLLSIIISCTPSDATSTDEDQQALEESIARIENGLELNLQIRGIDSVQTYNIEDRLRELRIPGVSIAVLKDGEIAWARGYGMADSAENRPVTTETLFQAGSISKPMAALRAHQLVEQGMIHLDSNVNQYLTSWHVPDNEFTANEKVTIRRILNHTAGLTVWGFPGYPRGDTIPTVPEILDGLGNTDSVRVYKEPGGGWQYSGGGYTIMQLMITDLEKRTFPEIMKTEVLTPLGMERSTYENPLPAR